MTDTDLLDIVNRVINSAEREAGFLKEAASNNRIRRQLLMNAGNTLSLLASELFVAAGGLKHN